MKDIKCQVCLEDEDEVSPQVTSRHQYDEEWRMKCKFKMSQLEEFISLKLAMKKCLNHMLASRLQEEEIDEGYQVSSMSWRWRWSEPSSYFKTSTWWRMKKWSASSRWAISKRSFAWVLPSKWRRSCLKYVLKMKMKWALKVNFKTSTKWSASSRWVISKRSFAWVLPSLWWSWICEDAPKKKLSHGGLWGSNPQDFVKQAQARKAFHLVEVKIVVIELKWNAQV